MRRHKARPARLLIFEVFSVGAKLLTCQLSLHLGWLLIPVQRGAGQYNTTDM